MLAFVYTNWWGYLDALYQIPVPSGSVSSSLLFCHLGCRNQLEPLVDTRFRAGFMCIQPFCS